MQRTTPAPHERLAFAIHQLPPGVPAAFLSLGQIIALVEKRLRWYGFADWRIHDVLCDQQQSVAVKIRSRDGVVLTISLARDCAAAEYGIHAPRALARRPSAPELPARRLSPLPLSIGGTAVSQLGAQPRGARPEVSH